MEVRFFTCKSTLLVIDNSILQVIQGVVTGHQVRWDRCSCHYAPRLSGRLEGGTPTTFHLEPAAVCRHINHASCTNLMVSCQYPPKLLGSHRLRSRSASRIGGHMTRWPPRWLPTRPPFTSKRTISSTRPAAHSTPHTLCFACAFTTLTRLRL